MATVLVVDDEPDLRWVLRGLFEDAGFAVAEAGDGRAALQAIEGRTPDVVLSDVRMPGMPGIDLLRALRTSRPDLPVVLLSAVEDIATAVDAIKEGAFDYQAKPFDPQRLLLTVQRAAEQHALRREVAELRSARTEGAVDFGDSAPARELRRTLDLVAARPSLAVLLVGESGTGKEVAAREIHRRSPVAAGPFVAIDCGALPEPLMESQLFGHRRGAFTGADRDRQGLFQMANDGTLFLDELGNLPLPLQAKLLRALQERAVVPVGASEPVPFRARLLCATNASLEDDVRAGRFRVDLFHRIAEFTLRLPPLRERAEDIATFAHRFLVEANAELGREVRDLATDAVEALCAHDWPGNLRELRNVVRRAVLLAADTVLRAGDLDLRAERAAEPRGDRAPPRLAGGTPPAAPARRATDAPAAGAAGADLADLAGDDALPLTERLRHASDRLEARLLADALRAHGGNKAAAARALQIDYTTLHRKLKRHGLLG